MNFRSGPIKKLIAGICGLFFLTPPLLLFIEGISNPLVEGSVELISEAGWNTILLLLGVTLLSSLLGLSAAYCNFRYSLWGQSFLKQAYYWPLAFPAYVIAFVALGALGPTGYSPQGQMWGLIGTLSLALFPYIYIFSSLGFQKIQKKDWEAHRILGGHEWTFLWRVLWPQIFPFYIAGLVLVGFETLADFGAASIINVNVVTTVIYKVWFGFFSFAGATALAAHYMVLVGLLLWAESKWCPPVELGCGEPLPPKKLSIFGQSLATGYCWGLWLVSFVLPTLQLMLWFPEGWSQWKGEQSLSALAQSVGLAMCCGIIVVVAGLLLISFLRHSRSHLANWSPMITFGYSLPGTILAVAFVIISQFVFGAQNGFTALLVLVVAMIYKFFSVAYRMISQAMAAVPVSWDEYSQTAMVSPKHLLLKGHWPVLKPASFAAMALVAIEVLKEMPISLMLAPSGFETLSIQIFNFTSEGEWEKASVPGLLLVIAGAFSAGIIFKNQKSVGA